MYNILIVDDEEMIRKLIRKYAEFDGHKVDFAELMNRNSVYRGREAEVSEKHACRMEAMGKALIK